eukprot:914175-Amphidinium_carterae.1
MLIVSRELLCELVFLLPLILHCPVTPSIVLQMTIVRVRIGQWVAAVRGSGAGSEIPRLITIFI